MSALADRARAALAQRTPRERIILAIGAAVLALFLLLVLVLTPARQMRESAVASHAEAARTLGAVQQATRAPASASASDPSGAPLRAVVSQSAEAAGLVIDRYDSQGDAVRVALADASGQALFVWLTTLREREGILVAEAQIQRQDAGTVSARLTLRRAA